MNTDKKGRKPQNVRAAKAPLHASMHIMERVHNVILLRWRLLLLVVSTPIIQITFHALARSGFLTALGLADKDTASRVPLGILINERDNMSYSAWAEQAKLGYYFNSDLYTNAPHSAVLFNPYFVVMGLLARLFHLSPLIVMIFASIISSALFALAVYALSRASGLQKASSEGATFFALFCSGPSWLLFVVHAALKHTGAGHRPFIGIDGYYFDVFPNSIFIAYPFASFNLALLSVTAVLIVRALNTEGKWSFARLLSASLMCACAVLVRPYDALILCMLFTGCIFVKNLQRYSYLGFKIRFDASYFDGLWICMVMLPACIYVYAVSRMPVWDGFASKSLTTGPSWLEMIVGFSIFWTFSLVGVARAIYERNGKVLFMAIWAIAGSLAILMLGGLMARFSSGLLIPYSILAAYGIAGLKRRRGLGAENVFAVSVVLMLSTIITSVFTYTSIFIQPVPSIDVEIESATTAIRLIEKKKIPTVLADCGTAIFLPGIAGFRVFAGHWSLTPDFLAKCSLLDRSGLSSSSGSLVFSAAELQNLIKEVSPQYILLRHQSPAERWLLTTHRAGAITQGARWDALVLLPSA